MRIGSVGQWLARRHLRFWLLLAATALLGLTALNPVMSLPRDSYVALFVLDITQSMNTPDAGGAGEPRTRLAAAKDAVRAALLGLPCGSEAGIAVFTEYRSFLLLAPVDICAGYAELASTLERLDWRMGWAGASQVSKGLHFALEADRALDPKPVLVFITDGHEAPPTDPSLRYPVENSGQRRVPGLIVGVGADALSPIPKFDMDGNPLGVWAAEEVAQLSVPTPGVGNLDPKDREAAALRVRQSTEHLSSLKEAHLKTLAAETDLRYLRLTSPGSLAEALRRPEFARTRSLPTDLRWVLAGIALAATAGAFAPRLSSRT